MNEIKFKPQNRNYLKPLKLNPKSNQKTLIPKMIIGDDQDKTSQLHARMSINLKKSSNN